MKKHTLLIALIALAAACYSASPAECSENAVQGVPVSSFVQEPPVTDTMSLTLDLGSKAQAGQLAIADVLTYNGANPTITPPAGWTLIRDDSSPTTRQSLYWHAVEVNDPSTQDWIFSEPVDAQGVVLLLDDVAETNPVDASSGNTGHSGTLTANSAATASNEDFIIALYATDFGGAGPGHDMPKNMSTIVDQQETPLDYWILATNQSNYGDNGQATTVTPQLFNWVAAQVAFKSATAAAAR